MYTNSDGLPSTPFCSGPLEGYTIIQLLSPLVFFFRIVDSLRYTATNRPVTEEELNRCDQNGDVAVEHTTV
jgi:branched-subunit amino acid permease